MDALEAVGDPELRDALLYARHAERPVTADELARARGVHRNVARSRLERLAGAGLLVAAYERRTGKSGPGAGRPAKTYSVAPELEAVQFPSRRYEELLDLLLDTLPARGRGRTLHALGAEFARRLLGEREAKPAATLGDGVEAMCAAVRDLGFQASLVEAGERDALVATPTCPLRPLVRRRPEAAELDRGMWAELAAAFTGRAVEEVECETRDCLADHASCRVLLRLR